MVCVAKAQAQLCAAAEVAALLTSLCSMEYVSPCMHDGALFHFVYILCAHLSVIKLHVSSAGLSYPRENGLSSRNPGVHLY